MAKPLTIILPGKIGDIIICLPIAKHFHDMGYDVHWPIYDGLVSNFTQGHIDYVNFIPVPFLTSIEDSFKIARKMGSEILDLSFTNHGCWDNENSKRFLSQSKPFDEFRYELANVDFAKKWSLHINRNPIREPQLWTHVIKAEQYAVTHFEGSNFAKSVKLENRDNIQIINIQPITPCVFDWLLVLEQAKYLVLLDSCFANLVEQLNFKNKKFFITRSEPLKTPTLKNEWVII